MNSILKNFFLILLMVFTQEVALCKENSLERLWAVKDRNGKDLLYLLPVNHSGLALEYDDYFDDVILSAFKRSRIFYYEGVGNGEDEPKPVCDPNILDKQSKEILGRAKEKAADMKIALHTFLYEKFADKKVADYGATKNLMVSGLRTYVETLDEMDLMESYNLDIRGYHDEITSRVEKTAQVEDDGLRGAVVHYLRSLRPDIQVRDLDTKYGVRRAYCGLGKERLLILQSVFGAKNSREAGMKEKIQKMNEEFIWLVRNSNIASDIGGLGDSLLDKSIICRRNEEWIEKILSKDEDEVKFVAAGARHLFNYKGGDVECKGLIDVLRGRGFFVSSVKH